MPRNLIRVFAVCLTSLCLASCASINGGSYPDDCGNYPCNSVSAHPTCQPNRGCMTTKGCSATYYYRCCDHRNYWIE